MEEDNGLRESIEAAWELTMERYAEQHQQPFDGFNGSPPKWFPENIRAMFFDYKDELSCITIDGNKITPAQVLEWISYRESLLNIINIDDADSVGFIPFRVETIIKELEKYKRAASKGKKEGLPLLSDPKSIRATRGNPDRMGKTYGFKAALRKTCDSLGVYNYDSLYDLLFGKEHVGSHDNGDTFELELISTSRRQKKYNIIYREFKGVFKEGSNRAQITKEKTYAEQRIKEYIGDFEQEN